MHARIRARTQTCAHAYSHARIQARMNTRTHIHTHTRTHAYMHAYTHAYAHVYSHAYRHAYRHAYTHARTVSYKSLNPVNKCKHLIDYRKSSIKRRGAYLKLKIFGVALNRGRRLFEGGAYSKTIFLT